MSEERWVDIEGYEGMYLISDRGRVMSLSRLRKNGNGDYRQKTKILSNSLTSTGYYKVDLKKDNKRKVFRVHRLVGIAFVENPDGKPQINHKDGNPLNNHHTNLEWTTQAENVRHALEMGLTPSFRISAETLDHLHHNKEMSVSEIAEKYQVTPRTIYKKMKEENVHLEPSAKYRIRTSWLKEQFENRRTNKDIAKEVGCDPSLISHYKKRIAERGNIYG